MFQGREKLRADEQNRDVLGIFRCWGVSMVTPLDDPSVSGRQGALLLAGCGSPTTWTLSSHRPWSHDLPLGSGSCLLKLIHHILQKPWIDAELIMFLIPPPCLCIPLGSTFSSPDSLPNLLLPHSQVVLSMFLHIYFPSFPFTSALLWLSCCPSLLPNPLHSNLEWRFSRLENWRIPIFSSSSSWDPQQDLEGVTAENLPCSAAAFAVQKESFESENPFSSAYNAGSTFPTLEMSTALFRPPPWELQMVTSVTSALGQFVVPNS